jgi:hypothetical protein
MFLFKKKNKADDKNKRSFQNPKILEVNLIKDEGKISFDRNKNFLVLAIVLFLAGLLVTEIYFGLSWWETQEIARAKTLHEDVAKITQEANKLRSQASAPLAYKAKSIAFTSLLNNHLYWSNFFSWLEKNTLSSVKYGAFNGDLSGLYTLGASAQSFADVSWQVKNFLNDPLTSKAEVVAASAAAKGKNKGQAGTVKFDLILQVKPEIFRK